MYTPTANESILRAARKSDEMLEPYEWKRSRTVLRRERASNRPDLADYRDLCQNLNGDWINAAGGSKGMINPLQVRPSPRDDEDEKEELRLYRDEGYGMNDLALHMKNLEIFFSLYIPSLTDMQKAVLKKCLVELYQKFHITWNTDVTKLKPQDFPIFSDLYALVQEKTKTEKENQVYTDLAMLLYDIAEGADSFIWNGHTTVSGNSRFTVMDTHALQGNRG